MLPSTKEMSFKEALAEHQNLMEQSPRAGAQRPSGQQDILAAGHWRAIRDGLCRHQVGAGPDGFRPSGCDNLNGAQQDLSPVAFLMQWAQRNREKDILGLGYEDDDHESQAFFENLPASQSADEQFVRLHLGRHSKRRKCEAPYALDDLGRLR